MTAASRPPLRTQRWAPLKQASGFTVTLGAASQGHPVSRGYPESREGTRGLERLPNSPKLPLPSRLQCVTKLIQTWSLVGRWQLGGPRDVRRKPVSVRRGTVTVHIAFTY